VRRRTSPVIDFRRYRVRMIVALALAIALHEILLGLVRGPVPPSDREDTAVATRIAIETARPTPTPAPTPPPAPVATPPPRATLGPVPQVAARAHGRPAKHRAGGALQLTPKAPRGRHANPSAAGSGNGSAAGTGEGDLPGVGGGLSGKGAGESGNGNGAVNANAPCGVVEFLPYNSPHYDKGTVSLGVSRRRAHRPVVGDQLEESELRDDLAAAAARCRSLDVSGAHSVHPRAHRRARLHGPAGVPENAVTGVLRAAFARPSKSER